MEKIINEFRVIETDDGFRIEIKGDKEKLRSFLAGFGPGFGRGFGPGSGRGFGPGSGPHKRWRHRQRGPGDFGWGPFGFGGFDPLVWIRAFCGPWDFEVDVEVEDDEETRQV